MNMKSLKRKNDYQEIDNFFEDILNTEEDFELSARILTAGILNDIKDISDSKNLTRKMLAEKIGTSASYLTQLYRGNKLLNFITLAKLKKALDIQIEIRVQSNYVQSDTDKIDNIIKTIKCHNGANWAIITSFKDVKETGNLSKTKEKLVG